MDIRTLNQKLQVKGMILQEKPAKSYSKINNAGASIEVYAIDEKTFYQRNGSGGWQKLSLAQIAGIRGFQDTNETQLLDLARQVQQVEDGEVNGTPCYHLLFVLDMPAYLPLFLPNVDPNTVDGLGEAWIGKEDGYIYRVLTRVEVDLQDGQVTTVTDLRLSSFNQPLAFPPTPAAP
jgi:hypothetical protein